MDRQTEIQQKNIKITTKPVLISPEITALYAESICKEME